MAKVAADTSPDDLAQLLALMGMIYYSPKGGGGGGGSRRGGSHKPDIKQIDSVAKEYGMDDDMRMDFGDHIEGLKAVGERGTKNDRGDFTYQQLREIAEEWLEDNYPGHLR